MTVSAGELLEIEAILAASAADREAVADLRRRFPHLSLTRCDASDVDTDKPFRTFERFHLYLVDGGAHCWQLTADPLRATGLLLAERRARS